MPLYQVETTSHLMVACVADDAAARAFAAEHYPDEEILHVYHHPRDAWVISKNLLGVSGKFDVCDVARSCLTQANGDKFGAMRLYMAQTGCDTDEARKVIESNMVAGW